MGEAGPSILIVEDDALIAMELEARVAAFGCAVLGPAPSVAAANRILDAALPTAALLDVNLGGERVTPIAARLGALGIPYALVTGYARVAFDEPELQHAAKLSKPVTEHELARTLRRLLSPAAAEPAATALSPLPGTPR